MKDTIWYKKGRMDARVKAVWEWIGRDPGNYTQTEDGRPIYAWLCFPDVARPAIPEFLASDMPCLAQTVTPYSCKQYGMHSPPSLIELEALGCIIGKAIKTGRYTVSRIEGHRIRFIVGTVR